MNGMNGLAARKQFVGLYQLAAGSIGVGATITHAPSLVAQLNPAVRTQAVILFTCAALVFGLIAWAGILLLRHRPVGSRVSVVAQLAQVVSWSSATTKYSLIAGAYAGARWTTDTVGPVVGATTSFQFAWSGPLADRFLVINCVPFLVIWLLFYSRRGRAGSVWRRGDGL
jgi:hypothetical protein